MSDKHCASDDGYSRLCPAFNDDNVVRIVGDGDAVAPLSQQLHSDVEPSQRGTLFFSCARKINRRSGWPHYRVKTGKNSSASA